MRLKNVVSLNSTPSLHAKLEQGRQNKKKKKKRLSPNIIFATRVEPKRLKTAALPKATNNGVTLDITCESDQKRRRDEPCHACIPTFSSCNPQLCTHNLSVRVQTTDGECDLRGRILSRPPRRSARRDSPSRRLRRRRTATWRAFRLARNRSRPSSSRRTATWRAVASTPPSLRTRPRRAPLPPDGR